MTDFATLSCNTGLKTVPLSGGAFPYGPLLKGLFQFFDEYLAAPPPPQSESNPCFKTIFLIFCCLCFTRMRRRDETKTRGGLWEGKVKNRGSLHFLTFFFALLPSRALFFNYFYMYFVFELLSESLCGGEKSPSHLLFAPDA